MALSLSHQVMISVSLVLCACVLMPRLLQGRGEAKPKPEHRKVPIGSNQHFQEVPKAKRPLHVGAKGAKPYPGLDQMKNVMEKEINSEKMGGSSHSLAFTLMPLYAIGVAVFAAYKFTKVKSKEKKSVGEREADKKSKETETQLLQLERHLSQTEQMLNSLLTQLDPLSNCVNTLASSQRDDVMNQLQSIRRLMRESGMDRSALENTANQTSEDTLEDLIHSFKEQEEAADDESEGENEDPDASEPCLSRRHMSEPLYDDRSTESPDLEDRDESEPDLTPDQEMSVLRKRNTRE
uniref:Resistance to inhibitors of cholinesterase protein 3 N-terminal domain-containing protein n=1 Tax=Leptobrachium leishanense TaxID=445787 RepID=A0A8C5M7K6_9ANUR